MINGFYTPVAIPTYDFDVSHQKPMLWLGSCFTENMGDKLNNFCFQINVNPFGIVYNPISIFNSLLDLLKKRKFRAEELVFHQGIWHSFSHHGRYSHPDKTKCLEKINFDIEHASKTFESCSIICLTVGSAFSYYLAETDTVVANCHKFPSKTFHKKLLSIKDVVSSFDNVYHQIRHLFPDKKFLFTLSPVRHIREGLPENQVSKAILRVAIQEIVSKFDNTYYFPSYEILLDELRDYRFYNEDMVHPTEIAVDYIFEKFSNAFFSDDTKKIVAEISGIIKALNHKPFFSETKEYKDFQVNTKNLITNFKTKHPEINIDKYCIEKKI